MLKLFVSSTLLTLLFFALGSETVAAQGAEQVTGCLTAQGSIKDLEIGDAPAKPCRVSATQIDLEGGGGALVNPASSNLR